MAIPARLTAREGRRFAFTLGAAFLTFGAIAWYRDHVIVPVLFGAICTALFAAGAVAPTRLGPAQRGWMRFGEAVGRFMTPITMGVVYFLVITPVGAIMRAIGKNPLYAKTSGESLWVSRGDKTQSDLDRQF